MKATASKEKSKGKIVMGKKLYKKGKKNLSKYLIQKAYMRKSVDKVRKLKCDTPITNVLKKLNMKASSPFVKVRQKSENLSGIVKTPY